MPDRPVVTLDVSVLMWLPVPPSSVKHPATDQTPKQAAEKAFWPVLGWKSFAI